MKKMLLSMMLICFSLVVVSLNVLFLTTMGLDGCILVIDRIIPGSFTVDTASGRLANRFELKGIRYTGDFGDVSLGRLQLSWSPLSLVEQKIDINSMLVKDLSVVTASQQDPSEPQAGPAPMFFPLPFELNIARGLLEKICRL